MAEESGAFDFGGVVEAITAKLIRRHPHVFGTERRGVASARTCGDLERGSRTIERRERAASRRAASATADGQACSTACPVALPALSRADKLSRRAAAVGFSWTDRDDVVAKIEEELDEVRDAVVG